MRSSGQGILVPLLLLLLSLSACKKSISEGVNEKLSPKPNVILVMTDDQGIGDLGAHGNPWIKTPNIDQFYKESVRLTDFHVSPLCTPTRSALITGQYPIKNGVWATFKGRDMLHDSMPTMPEIFKKNGYTTALFGKWHLGNNYPSRPTDRGFDLAIHHSSGGVGELSDYWGNNYFDDTYLVNNSPTNFDGYCTDIWFDEAIKFIEKEREKPFFMYLPTNAPHHPLYVDKKYSEPYEDLENSKIPSAEFYGMISNIDENFGELIKALKNTGLEENTILIFCSDNGSQFGVSEDYALGWNKGYRGRKADQLEAGHRVPFFIRWPGGNVMGGRDISELTAHVDVLPTLAGLCNIDLPLEYEGDGVDFSKTLFRDDISLSERTLFVHHRQDYRPPEPVMGSCIMQGNWRLIDGEYLYDISKDPMQLNNVIDQHLAVKNSLLQENALFIKEVEQKKAYKELAYNIVGNEIQPKTKLTIQHAIGEDGPIWKQEEISAGIKNKNALHPIAIAKAGSYEISCRRWPEECPGEIWGIPEKNPKDMFNYKPIHPEKVQIKLYGETYEKVVLPGDEKVVFRLDLEAGKTLLETNFIEANAQYGVYYTYIELLNPQP